MIVQCINCGRNSPDKDDWFLIAKLKWSSSSKQWLSGNTIREDESLDEAFERIGKNWYCPNCTMIGFDNAFGLPVRNSYQKN